ncbi:hypothetical protein Rsub_00952 [Raphidocelis subcapitata]|uniref:Acyl-coenzyme A oxidase n=1 Tax=Raphidocelis subcapitata TaxID=307507 RepID=A0A2V0NRP8_9CHLO|nr:hypothetical protein Rsub_00952 [Raphidocelis subcapitata]|eukprot:GBF88240.1 hypothetical protein Rsub_00952 [Raphidocelis subcapitata]
MANRIEVLARQLTLAGPGESQGAGQEVLVGLCPRKLEAYLTHDNADLRARIFEFLKDPLYTPNDYLSLMEFRELTLQRLKRFLDQRFFSIRDYLSDPRRFQAALESLSFCDYSLAIKCGVHMTLCGGTICKLGTKKHHDAYLPGIDSLDLPGCFGMTELGHGSNVMGIETTAHYDAASGEFIINTPSNEASKIWIGGSGQHGKVCTVFAQLTVGGRWEGPHVFVVRLRDDAGRIMPGVRIKDMGPKMGLNGVDNGQIWFDNVRVSRDALLDAFASVDASGAYSSPIRSVAQRFGTMVGGLTTGRMLIAQGAVDAMKIGLTIALRYSAARPQFGDKLILDYLTHQRRLLPGLASTFALHLAMKRLKDLVAAGRPSDAKTIHIFSSGIKAAATWTRVEVLQHCREACGGMGFLSSNRIGNMLNDTNVDVTFEGDNTVLMQSVARSLLEDTAAVRAAAAAAAAPKRFDLAASGGAPASDPATLLALLRAREERLIAGAAAAAAGAAGGKKEAALDDQQDRIVELGWAYTERMCLQNMLAEAARASAADEATGRALRTLAALYGASRAERAAAPLLASGAICGAGAEALRGAVNAACRALGGGGARAPALVLCEAFGIPDHLLRAPIAFNWRDIGRE